MDIVDSCISECLPLAREEALPGQLHEALWNVIGAASSGRLVLLQGSTQSCS